MREIKFRGKRVDTGEWVYGMPLFANYDDVNETCILSGPDHNPTTGFTSPDNNLFINVITETVGQCTGTKANGEEIYEGDIVEYDHEYGPVTAVVKWMIGEGEDALISGLCLDPISQQDHERDEEVHFRVIGNIHENPDPV